MNKKEQRKLARMHRAKDWLKNQSGSEVQILHAYKKRYKVDIFLAFADLQSAGYLFSPSYTQSIQQTKASINKQQALKRQRKQKENFDEFSDATFAFIAGYTSGGIPYGTTWEELSLEPYASQEEIEMAYQRENSKHEKDMDDEQFFCLF